MDHSGERRIRVVTVDDHPMFAYGIKSLVNTLADDIEIVGVATSGSEGVELVEEQLPDVVLMDVRMPNVEGIEAAAKIHELFPEVKIVMLTISEDPRDVHATLSAGVVGYLSKEIDADQLIAAIRAVHAGEVVLSPFAASVSFADPEQTEPLTDAELYALKLMARGYEHSVIAREIAVSDSTLKRMMHDIHRKLGVTNRIQALVVAAKRGLI